MTDQPLSARAYAAAVRMHAATPGMAKPKPEDFAHHDVAPEPDPAAQAAPPQPTVADAAVRDALARMQTAAGVRFTEPPGGDAA